MKITLALDSGAHSIYNRYAAGGREKKNTGRTGKKGGLSRKHSTWEFYDSEAFVTYLDKYITYCKANASKFEFYVTLDAIFNPELSWKLYRLLLDEGLKPLPVYHFGEPIEYLKRMCKETDYVGIGGIGQDVTAQKFIPFGTEVFKYLKGSKIRTHGFAMSSSKLLQRFPWHSVDSTTPFVHSRNGCIMVPSRVGNKLVYRKPHIFDVTDRTVGRRNGSHYFFLSPLVKQAVDEYLATLNLTGEDVCNHYKFRDAANAVFMTRMFEEMNGIKYYASGRTGGKLNLMPSLLSRFVKASVTDFHFLGSFFDIKPIEVLLPLQQEYNNGNRKPTPRPQAGKPRPSLARLHPGADSPVLSSKPRVRVQR